MEEEYRMDDEEEEDVMGLLFAANSSDGDFVPPSGMGKGNGKSRAVAMDSVVNSPESVGASSSTRVQRKRRPKPFPDDAETEHRIKDDHDDHETDEADSLPAQYPRLRLLSSMLVPRNAVGRRPQRRRRHRHGRSATTAGASRAGQKCAAR